MKRPRAVRAEDEWYPESRESIDVIIDDAAPVDTGLVDMSGTKIWRTATKERCGY